MASLIVISAVMDSSLFTAKVACAVEVTQIQNESLKTYIDLTVKKLGSAFFLYDTEPFMALSRERTCQSQNQ